MWYAYTSMFDCLCLLGTFKVYHYHSFFDMNTYVPVRKIIKVVSTHRPAKRERHTTLQECLDSSKEPRRRKWKPWIMFLLFTSGLYYIYVHRADLFPDMFDRVVPVDTQIVANTEAYTKAPKGSRATYTVDSMEIYDPKVFGDPDNTIKHKNETVTIDAEIERQRQALDIPSCILKIPTGKVVINKTSINFTDDNIHPGVKKGGYYRPSDCKPKHRIGIVVPYRNRSHNLGIFLNNIHPFLMNQKLEYQIFVIEQQGKALFNKGRLFNAGFQEMMKFNTFHCVIFHDLDLLPMNPSIQYSCPMLPRHLCATVDDTDLKKNHNKTFEFKSVFGGVISMSIEQFLRANGYSNLYFGWGGEDNDMFWRLRASGYPVVRYNKSVGVYTVLPHERQPENPFRHHLLSRAMERYKTDGLEDLEYYVIITKFYHLCTYLMVDINPRGDNITEINNKWSHSLYKF